MAGIKLIRQEEAGIVDNQRRGSVLMTAGKVLLWMDLIPLIFTYVGLRSGSHFWLWWLIAEGVAGILLVAIGSAKRGSLTRSAR
jgi:hypothetical protein